MLFSHGFNNDNNEMMTIVIILFSATDLETQHDYMSHE